MTLLEEVPVDAARFLFNSFEANTRIDFDLDLAVQEDSQNPVYYVQYAHARICSILKNLKADGIEPRDCTPQELALLTAPEELRLIRYLAGLHQRGGELRPHQGPGQNHPLRDELVHPVPQVPTTPAGSRAATRHCSGAALPVHRHLAPCWENGLALFKVTAPGVYVSSAQMVI